MLRLAGPHKVVPYQNERNFMVYIPLGAGAAIPPWNFPAAIATGMTAAALVTGNTVVLKPSEESPVIAAKMVEILYEAGIPKQALQFVTGLGEVVGDALVKHPKTRFIAFTGSKDVGLLISESAGKRQPGQLWIKRAVLEMGGKDATIVDEEADVDAAVEGVAQAAFGYQGQKCSACSRAIVSEKVYDTFVQKLVERAKKVSVGPAEDPNNYMGPVVSETALNGILNYIEVGKREGKIVAGGGRAPGDGYFVQPTVIADVDPRARVAQEEIGEGGRVIPRRESLPEPEMHGRDGGGTSVWRIQYVGNRFENRRQRLPAPLLAGKIDRRKSELRNVVFFFTPNR